MPDQSGWCYIRNASDVSDLHVSIVCEEDSDLVTLFFCFCVMSHREDSFKHKSIRQNNWILTVVHHAVICFGRKWIKTRCMLASVLYLIYEGIYVTAFASYRRDIGIVLRSESLTN